MTPQIIPEWSAKARADIRAIIEYISDENPVATQALKDEIESKVSTLAEHPKLFKPGRLKGTREMVVRPNYVVVYREGSHSVTVLRVLHAAQHWP